jgi:integrase
MMGRRGNGEGSISRRKDGRWEAKYTAHTADGPKRRALYGKTRKEAADNLARVLADRASGYTFDTENMTVGEYLDRWLKDTDQGSVRTSTYERHEQIVRLHLKPAIGRVKLSKLTPAHLQGLYRDKLDSRLSPATVQKIHAVLHKALAQALKWNMIPRNAADAVKAPRPAPEEMHPLSPDEARRLIEAVSGDKLEALYVLAVQTGMRQGELLALKWEDVDLNEGVIHIRHTLARSRGRITLGEPKTRGSRRPVHLTDMAVAALKTHLERQLEEIERLGDLYRDNGLVFTSGVGTLINPTNLRRRSFAPLLQRAGLPQVRFHDLRHTCATLLFSKGAHPKHVQELLGHATVAITLDTYSHVIPGMGNYIARAMEDVFSYSGLR